MCFTEFLGYTCGHTSLPVKRPCPMTTQSHVNPICPFPACRPLLAFTMCPPCARIVHGRWVDIVIHEHEFMHARGACHCPVRFPYLQQPRVVDHSTDYSIDCSEDVEGAGREAFAAPHHTRANSIASTHTMRSIDTASSSPTIILAPILKRESPPPASEPFHFSPSAEVFTPSLQPSSLPPLNEIFDMPPDFDFGMGNLDLSIPPVGRSGGGVVNREPRGHATTDKGKGKAKEKDVTGQKERDDRNYHAQNYSDSDFHPQHHAGDGSATSSTTLASSDQSVPPMYETREGPDHKIEIATRMMSQYGSEWITEHRERHQNGTCDCRCSFTKYPGQYIPLLEEATTEELKDDLSKTFPGFSFASEFNAPYNEVPDPLFSDRSSHRRDDLHYGTPGFHSDGYVPAPTTTPAEVTDQPSFPYHANFDEELAQAISHHFPPMPSPSMPPPAHLPPAPAPTQSPYDVDVWKWSMPPDPNRAMLPRGHQPTSFGEPARWACAPPENNGDMRGGGTSVPRPIDMQVIAYDVNDIPIVGLPIGAGPEGDSHMPPFEACELHYPKIRHSHHRHATF
ncbi:uncharacterized protein GGS22DRAFT_194082 [Annulohypoxylon maeteangense]|uniref:uncharacterized protein n=1 Tax=Annulohypoxylon maeteangense TaxID=1927788 RepID=UPI002008E4F0|nr:uncharacterized protein GGS22DRAFT_194082 [Annulohypoxylon maeteangense]KAI0889696.1 hypothetical protein GGS22DRAFT_194082 [Annulohypoxylon maeteangense]